MRFFDMKYLQYHNFGLGDSCWGKPTKMFDPTQRKSKIQPPFFDPKIMAKGLLREPMQVNKPLIKPYLWGVYVLGGWVDQSWICGSPAPWCPGEPEQLRNCNVWPGVMMYEYEVYNVAWQTWKYAKPRLSRVYYWDVLLVLSNWVISPLFEVGYLRPLSRL